MDSPGSEISGDSEVSTFLCQLGLQKYIDLFHQHEFDSLSRLVLVTDTDLIEMGISAIGARRQLLAALANIITSEPKKRFKRQLVSPARSSQSSHSSFIQVPKPIVPANAWQAPPKQRPSATFRSKTPRLSFNQPSREELSKPGPGQHDVPGMADFIRKQSRYRSSSAPVLNSRVTKTATSPPPGAYNVRDPRQLGFTDTWSAQKDQAAFRSKTPRHKVSKAVCPTTGYDLPDGRVRNPKQRSAVFASTGKRLDDPTRRHSTIATTPFYNVEEKDSLAYHTKQKGNTWHSAKSKTPRLPSPRTTEEPLSALVEWTDPLSIAANLQHELVK